LGDAKKVSPTIAEHLVAAARKDSSPRVRSQLACSARRLPAGESLAIVRELLQPSEDVDDPHIPMLLWWAIEDKAHAARGLFDSPEVRQAPIVQKFILTRLARRYMAAGSEEDYNA